MHSLQSAKLRLTIGIAVALLPSSLLCQPLDQAYHNNAEILAQLQGYARQFPTWISIDSIGHSAEDSLPIWCAKISDNPRQIEPEAALLFIGQVHAEEVVGVELVLEIMKQMLENNDDNVMRQRLEGLEIYIIPTANPEGLEVVHSGLDVTFRKNKRDNVGDGVLRISDEEGWDTSGVDLNRNFGTHWDRGDTLFRPEDNLRYNAYRGAAPFSEPESRAIRDLALSRPFLYSIVYHSSRTGNNTEQFIAPWFWRENGIIKRPPDYLAINALGERVAGMIPKMRDRNGTYRPVQSMQRKGQLQDWFYVETGCIQFMAEVSADIHPAEDSMRMVIADNLPSVWYLMDLALGLEGLDGYGTLTVMATSDLNEPPYDHLESWLVVDDTNHPILDPRRTSIENGRFDWLLPEGQHQVNLSRHEYFPFQAEVEIRSGERTVLDAEMEFNGHFLYQYRLQIVSAGDATNALLYEYDILRKSWFPCAQLSADSIESYAHNKGIRQLLALAPFHLPMIRNVSINSDTILFFNLPPAGVAYLENFSRVREWNHQGQGWGIATFDGRSCLTESAFGDYPTDANMWLELNEIVRLDTARATMRIIHLPYCEPQDDYQEISWWTNPQDIHSKRYSQLRASRQPTEIYGAEIPDWDTLYVSLDSLDRGDLNVRFKVSSDEAIGEDGWLIEEVAIFVEGYESSVPEETLAPLTLHLEPPYPNPFNSTVSISFSLGQGSEPVSLTVYDLQGRLVADLLDKRTYEAGEHKAIWDAKGLGSGLYMVRLQEGGQTLVHKVVLMR